MAAFRRLPLPNDLERPHRPRPRTGIRDYDLIYFDEDLSWAAEDAVIQGVAAATLGLSVPWRRAIRPVCIFWFEPRFGRPLPDCPRPSGTSAIRFSRSRRRRPARGRRQARRGGAVWPR